MLGFNERGKEILREMRTTAKLPVIMKAQDIKALSLEAKRQFECESIADDIYALALPKTGKIWQKLYGEYNYKIIMLDFTKLNMEEIQAYCKSDRAIINFHFFRHFMIIQEIAIILASYGITKFSAEDVKELFIALDMHNEKGRVSFLHAKKLLAFLKLSHEIPLSH